MRAVLTGKSGPVYGQAIPLDRDEVSIGRGTANTIVIADRSVSREHCVLKLEADRIVVRDLESYNGTFVNGLRVREASLSDGDELTVGEVAFRFRTTAADSSVLFSPSEGLTICSPDVPLAREMATLRRIGEIARTVQTLYLEHDESRREAEERLFQLICELIPSRRAALLLAEGGHTVPFAGRNTHMAAPVPVPEAVVEEILRGGTAVSGTSNGSSYLAAPMTVSGRTTGVLYLDSGSSQRDYLPGDVEMITALCEILALGIENARDLDSLRTENVQLRSGQNADTMMVGSSPAMKSLADAIGRVARGNTTVLILGESGTGKELVARAIHRNSPRAARPFVAINCAAVTDTLLESEFFGHEKGAFTGAYTQRKGKLETADGGTVFLDEAGELAPALQAKLLRVLQEREFERVGGSRPIRVDIRVIAATNRELEQDVRSGRFREDLYYRLNVVPLRVPPLRQRREDVPALANFFVRKFSEQVGRNVTGLSREARALLAAYEWPGNVRELQNVIERAVVMGSSEVVTPDDLADLLPDTPATESGESEGGFHEAVRQARRQLIAAALEQASGNVTEAAHALKLHPNYLHRLITNLGLRTLTSGV